MANLHGISSGKTSPALSAATMARTSVPSSRKSAGSKTVRLMSLSLTNGNPQDRYWRKITQSHGGYLTLSTGECPREENASTLSQILLASVPRTYYLSPTACLGILRRASARGKELPAVLKKALERQAAA